MRGPVILGTLSLLFLAGCGGSATQPSGSPSGGTNPVPTVNSLSPNSAVVGGADFTLTVNGANFVSGSVVNFAGTARSTTFVSATQLISAIPAAAIASAGTASVTVTNPPPGGTSNAVNFTVNTASSETFTPTGNMTTRRAWHSATLLPNGKVLIAGGSDGSQPLASADLYDPATSMFASTGNMTTIRGGHSATLLPNGKVLMLSDTGELYDPSTGIFTPTFSPPQRAPATLLANGKILLTGDDHADLYDPASGTSERTGPYVNPVPVLWLTVTLLLDGRVLLTGCKGQVCTAAELFDPHTGTFSATGPPIHRWIEFVDTATLLTNGTVLLVESVLEPWPEDVAEVYDPATGTFTVIGNTIAPAHEFSATVRLADGTVLVTGGDLPGGNGYAATELYLPPTRTFASAGNMTTPRYGHTATLLPDGTVLIAGGITVWGSPPQVTAKAEVYTPPR